MDLIGFKGHSHADADQDYARGHRQRFDPMVDIFGDIRRVGTVLTSIPCAAG